MICRFFIVLFLIHGLALSTSLSQNQDDQVAEVKKRPFGPVIKFEPSGMMHRYSKALLGIEYFIASEVSFQHHIGPVFSAENYSFDNPQYESVRGFAFNNEFRWYFFNSGLWDPYGDGRRASGTIKSAYFGIEADYNYSEIQTFDILRVDCDFDCSFFQKVDAQLDRNWMGMAFVVGAQFIFNRKFSLDINGGFGQRLLWLSNEIPHRNSDFTYPGIELNTDDKWMPYPSLSFNVGYCLY